jgi:hypothetical protein
MEKWRQQFSIGYFAIAVIALIALQSYFTNSMQEAIAYSDFKALVKRGVVSNLVIKDKTIHGENPEGIKEAIPQGTA